MDIKDTTQNGKKHISNNYYGHIILVLIVAAFIILVYLIYRLIKDMNNNDNGEYTDHIVETTYVMRDLDPKIPTFSIILDSPESRILIKKAMISGQVYSDYRVSYVDGNIDTTQLKIGNNVIDLITRRYRTLQEGVPTFFKINDVIFSKQGDGYVGIRGNMRANIKYNANDNTYELSINNTIVGNVVPRRSREELVWDVIFTDNNMSMGITDILVMLSMTTVFVKSYN